MNDTELSKDRFKPLTYEQMYGVEEPEPDGRPLELDESDTIGEEDEDREENAPERSNDEYER